MRNLFSTGVLVVGLAFTAIAMAQPQSGPPIPYEDPGACPFEGWVYRDWQALKTVKLFR